MKRIYYLKKNRGFSLVEIAIVCIILGLCMVPLFTIMSKGSSGTIRNRNEILAQQYASNLIAHCHLMAFDDDFLKEKTNEIVNSDQLTLTLNGVETKNEIKEEGFSKIATRTVTIKDFSPSGWPYKYKVITVKIDWLQPGEPKHNVTLSGLISCSNI